MRVSGRRTGALRWHGGRNRSGRGDLSPDVDFVGNVSGGGGAGQGHTELVSTLWTRQPKYLPFGIACGYYPGSLHPTGGASSRVRHGAFDARRKRSPV